MDESKTVRDDDWQFQQYIRSLEQLHKAARSLLTLATSFLGAIFVFMSLGEGSIPIYMKYSGIQLLAAIGVLCLNLTIAASIMVLLPRKLTFDKDPEIETKFEVLQDHKAKWLYASASIFGISMLVFGLMLVVTFMFVL